MARIGAERLVAWMADRIAHATRVMAAGVGLVVTATPLALADEPARAERPAAVDIRRLGAELDLFAAEARHERWANAWTGLGVGSVMLPTGIILLQRSDGVSEALAIGLIVGGGAQLMSVPFAFLRTRMDDVRDDFRERQSRDADDERTLLAVEDEWRNAAAAAHHLRTLGGMIMLILGGAHLAAGAVLLIAPAGILGLNRAGQYTWGGTLLGIGASVGTIGVRFSMEESPEERSWNTYQLMAPPRAPPSPPRVSLGLTPVAGGAVGVAVLAF